MSNICSTAIIHPGALVADDVIIHDYVVIYPNVKIESGVEIFDHSVIGKVPKAPGCTKRKIDSYDKETIIGENSVLSVGCVIYAGTQIGRNTLIGDHASTREDVIIGNDCIIARNVSINYNTKIGDHTKIMDNTHITGNAMIEDHVFISVLVSTTNDNSMGQGAYSDEREKGPHIKRGAMIGANANILPAIEIGENAMIGAGSVVTKNIPADKLAMGVPAKVIRDL